LFSNAQGFGEIRLVASKLVRRLVLILSAVIVVDTMFYTALAPLLPHFAVRYGLSKGGAGVLSGMYAAGVLTASVPGGIAASRFGAKRAVFIGTALTAAASLAFGLATDIWTLSLARFAQGVGSACSWAGALAWVVAVAAPGRRGTVIGTTMGAAVFGALLGPVLGAVATLAGVRATFIGVSAGGFALAAQVLATEGAPAQPQPLSALRRADARLLGGLWLVSLPALLFGVLNVLVPLKLHGHGWSGVAIGALFFATAMLEMALNPLLGRFTDRRGFLLPIRLALLASVAISLALAWANAAALVATLAVAAGIGYGAFFTPGMALVSVSAEQRGIALGIAFGVMNGAWAVGNAIGPAAGGALAQAAGDSLPYLLLAGICLVTLATMRVYLQPRSRPSSS
jgi:MFS family permease